MMRKNNTHKYLALRGDKVVTTSINPRLFDAIYRRAAREAINGKTQIYIGMTLPIEAVVELRNLVGTSRRDYYSMRSALEGMGACNGSSDPFEGVEDPEEPEDPRFEAACRADGWSEPMTQSSNRRNARRRKRRSWAEHYDYEEDM